jgi:hypothetical protein
MNPSEYRITEIQKVTLNGSRKIAFKAFRRINDAYQFVGAYTAPTETPTRDLWKIAHYGDESDKS